VRTSNVQVMAQARRAMPLMNAVQRAEAVAILAGMRTANAGDDWRLTCAQAWEGDMQGVRIAIAAALHDGGTEALAHLRKMLPFLMREANRKPALGAALARAMSAAIADPDLLGRTANAVSIDEEPGITAALRQWRSREVFETDLGSADLRGLSRELLNRSIFSARVTNADFLNEVGAAVDDILSGKTNMAQGRWRLLRKLKELGYDPMTGFPGDMANVPPAERDSLQDVSSTQRLDLIIETNVRMASCYAQHLAGNTPYALHAYPAWELVRLFHRDVPRGSPESKSVGWERRWQDAGESVSWEHALQEPMIALKDSRIWQALGDGAGGYRDTLGNPYPPFAFRSGKGRRPFPRPRCIDLGLVSGDETPRRTEAQLSPGEKEVRAVADRLSPELRAELERELNTDAEREALDRTQAEHEAAQRAVRDKRIVRAPDVQAEHRARMAALTKGVE
jgi:hypothetical protein